MTGDGDVKATFQPLGHAPGEPVTPTAEVPDAIARIVETWNRMIPRRVRRLTQYRYQAMRLLLREFTVDEVCDAIDWYSQQPWQRQQRAWKQFDNWMDAQVVTQWLEDRDAQEERAEAAALRNRSSREHAEEARRRLRQREHAFDDLSREQRDGYVARVLSAMPAYLTNNAERVRRMAIELMVTETEHDRESASGT